MSIRLSEKHGVNPSVGICFYCGKEDGTVVLLGRLPGDQEAPRQAVFTKEPCAECKEHMKQGIMLLEVLDGQSGDNPRRTGRMWVITEDAARRLFHPEEVVEDVLKKRVAFLEESVATKLGLPKKEGA